MGVRDIADLDERVINGIVFSVYLNDKNIHFKEWSTTDDCIYYYPLATLADNGNAKFDKHECTVPFESLYLIDESDRRILGIPSFYDKAMRLRGEGMLNCSDFSYKLELLTYVPDGEIIPFEREENIFFCKSKKYLLSEDQYRLFIAVNRFIQTPDNKKTTDFNLRNFAQIKQFALKANCELDSYLENENVFVPEKIKLNLKSAIE